MAEARTEAEVEFEKEERRGKKKRKANVSSGIDGDDDLGTLFGGATTGKLPRFANRITLKVLNSLKLLLCRIYFATLVSCTNQWLAGCSNALL